MKQILAGVVRHIISAGGFSTGLHALQSGDKVSAAIGFILAAGGVVLSVLHKVEGAVAKVVSLAANIQHPAAASDAGARQAGTSALGCLWVLVVAVAMTGCGTSGNKVVPGNHISGFIGGQPFAIDNPKNTALHGVELSHTSGSNTFTLKIADLASTNDPQVIDSSYAGQAAVMKTMFDGIKDVTSIAVDSAVKAAFKSVDARQPGGSVRGVVDASDASRPVAARPVPPPSDSPALSPVAQPFIVHPLYQNPYGMTSTSNVVYVPGYPNLSSLYPISR